MSEKEDSWNSSSDSSSDYEIGRPKKRRGRFELNFRIVGFFLKEETQKSQLGRKSQGKTKGTLPFKGEGG
jgi:hypothetical protein